MALKDGNSAQKDLTVVSNPGSYPVAPKDGDLSQSGQRASFDSIKRVSSVHGSRNLPKNRASDAENISMSMPGLVTLPVITSEISGSQTLDSHHSSQPVTYSPTEETPLSNVRTGKQSIPRLQRRPVQRNIAYSESSVRHQLTKRIDATDDMGQQAQP